MPASSKQAQQDLTHEQKVKNFKEALARNLRYTMGISSQHITEMFNYQIVSMAVRDQIMDRWLATSDDYESLNPRTVYYLSLEFLIGSLLANNVINLGMEDVVRDALKDTPFTWEQTRNYEMDAGLGNGGLGRLAACFLDSLATLDIPSIGYGLRYDYGIFKQKIVNGAQVEEPDNWLRNGYPWEFRRAEREYHVQFGGEVKVYELEGRQQWRWIPRNRVRGIAFDIPVVGYSGKTINTLRLWSAYADNEFDLEDFNKGSYVDAVQDKVLAENLTKVLYPNDNIDQGKELRLRQQYFFVSCTVQDILHRHLSRGNSLYDMPAKLFIQLNDTHPTLVIPELMHILMDDHGMGWDEAWEITTSCVGYTNHTILPEALEKWNLPKFAALLPRHMQIIYEINGRFLKQVAFRYPGDKARLARMSIIQEGPVQQVRMAHLALIGAAKVNGVAEIHSEILKNNIFRDFADQWPDKFTNVTNGITQRRWLLNANPKLSALITSKIGNGWITNLQELRKLEAYVDDELFLEQFSAIKRENKCRLADYIYRTQHIRVNPDSIFDVQVKRLHEYKRQLLLAIYIIALYNRILENPTMEFQPRTFIFSGKAAPGYATAKLVIRLIHTIGEAVNTNSLMQDKLKVVFLPDYCVSLAEHIIPAANVSEQISLAGTEASGTGNMKLMLNGAITLGTMDGANVEIFREVGADNIFIFGMNAEEVLEKRKNYSPNDVYVSNPEIRKIIDSLRNDAFNVLTPGLFTPLAQSLLDFGDFYMLLADFQSYSDAQDKVAELYKRPKEWARKALLNVAHAGKFSSDRTIREYCDNIWHVSAVRNH